MDDMNKSIDESPSHDINLKNSETLQPSEIELRIPVLVTVKNQ